MLTKPFENIFAKTKQQIRAEENKLTIIADHREKNSLVISELISHNIQVEIKNLPVADFLLGNLAIERKSLVSDTPVIIRENNSIKMIPIGDAFNLHRKNNKLKVMGIDFTNKKIGWFEVYDVTKHKSKKIYGISISPFVKRKNENEKNFAIKVTEGHNVYIFRKKKIMCIPTSKLVKGDYILVVPPKLEENKPKLDKSLEEFLNDVQSDSIKKYTISKKYFKLGSSQSKYKNVNFNKDFFFVLGLWAAEGSYKRENLGFSQKDKKRNKIIKFYLKKVFGNFSFNRDTYWAGGKAYVKLFRDVLGLKTGAENKKIPSIVFTANKNFKSEFIKGYLFGDGYINKEKTRRNPQLMALSKSKELICGLSYLLYSMGIKNRVNEEYKNYKGNRVKYYLIRIKTGDLKNFVKVIGQIPTKELNLLPSISTEIPFYAQFSFYRPLLKLKEEEIIFLFEIIEKFKTLRRYSQDYMEKIIEIVKLNPSKINFSKMYGFNYGTLRDITNKYVKKSPHHFLKIVDIIRNKKGLKTININLKKLKNILNKIHVNTYLNLYTNLTPEVIKNVLWKLERKIGLETLFLLAKIHKKEIYLERVHNIEKIQGEFEVYDFSVKNAENFVGGNIPLLLHNTVSDFLSSMINKRLSQQLIELKQYPQQLLIIEGIDEHELYNDIEKQGIHPNAIRGFLLDILLKYQVPIIFTKDYADTAKFLYVLLKKPKEDNLSIRAKKHAKTPKEQLQFILEGIPGIGPATAKKLLKKFHTIKNIINQDLETLKKEIGKKADIFQLLDRKY